MRLIGAKYLVKEKSTMGERMKLIIAGSRMIKVSSEDFMSLLNLHKIYYLNISEIVSGGAIGVDLSGEDFANLFGFKLKKFPADWEEHGKAAGPIRNRQMAEYADALLLIWDGESRGSASMKKEMQKLKKPIYEVIVKTENV
jgi:septum formation topological specificity factor MinE